MTGIEQVLEIPQRGCQMPVEACAHQKMFSFTENLYFIPNRKANPKEILLCTYEGCEKIFSSRQYLNVSKINLRAGAVLASCVVASTILTSISLLCSYFMQCCLLSFNPHYSVFLLCFVYLILVIHTLLATVKHFFVCDKHYIDTVDN